MEVKNHGFTRKKALIIVVFFALITVAFLFLRWNRDSNTEFTTTESRKKFLQSIGWEIDASSEEEKTVVIPEKFHGVMEEYNKMQLEQGLDLSPYAGEQCSQYTYKLLNYPGQKENVYLSIYIKNHKLIAGDIHTNSVNGFMQGIMPTDRSE